MKRSILFLVIFFSALAVQAQFVSRLGRFQVDQVRGCAPFTITITNTNLITVGECTPGRPCLMDFLGNNTQLQNTTTFTYTTAGTYKLSVFYQSILNDDITITVDPNIQPAFEVYTCAASQVFVNVTDRTYDQYTIDFGDASPVVQIPSGSSQTAQHTYAAIANYTISVQGRKLNAANNCNLSTKNFQALASLPTTQLSALSAVDPTTLKVDFNPQSNIQYQFDIATNTNNFLPFKSVYETTSVTVPSLQLDDNYYCVRVSVFDACVGQYVNFSQPVCSHNFDLTLSSNVNQLNWLTAPTGVGRVEVLRDKNLYTSIPGAPLAFGDVDVNCNVSYCYAIRSVYSGGASSTSLEKCGTAFTTTKPATVVNTSAVVLANGVQLDWIQDANFKATLYTLSRSFNQGVYNTLSTASLPKILDESYTTNDAVCYKIVYEDECKNNSDSSEPICPIRLRGTINSANDIALSWSDYAGWSSGVQTYLVEKYDKDGVLVRTFNVGNVSTFIDDQPDPRNQVVSYRIVAKPNQSALLVSISNQMTFTKSINLIYPTAFTPDGQGPSENEVFEVKGQFISRMELSIFDRWGSLVFYTDKNESWNGTQQGALLPVATYVWTANVTDLIGRTFKRRGTVVLVRK